MSKNAIETSSVSLTNDNNSESIQELIKKLEATNLELMNKKENYSECIVVSFTILFVFSLFGLSITWITMSIIAMSNESSSSLQQECMKTNIWAALCTSVCVMTAGMIINIWSLNKDSDKDIVERGIISLVINVALSIWKYLELFAPCAINKLEQRMIYKLLLASFIADIICYGTIIITLIVLIIKAIQDHYKLVELNQNLSKEPTHFDNV